LAFAEFKLMRERFGHEYGHIGHAEEEGPFVSFTDLFIGILFLFLILVAALMLMHQEGVQAARREVQADTQAALAEAEALVAVRQELKVLQARTDAAAKRDAEHPPFRLAMVYNVYQAQPFSNDWTFSRTVQVFRSPDNRCLLNVILRNNFSMAWRPPVDPRDIPTAQSPDVSQKGTPCRISASGEHWKTSAETGGVDRVSETYYRGMSVLHKRDGDERVRIVYDILAIYDDYFR
jgi:hypothetical protein